MQERKNLGLFVHRARASGACCCSFHVAPGALACQGERARKIDAGAPFHFMLISAALLLKAHFQKHAPSLVELNCECRPSRYYVSALLLPVTIMNYPMVS
jgi:hypothetical protein